MHKQAAAHPCIQLLVLICISISDIGIAFDSPICCIHIKMIAAFFRMPRQQLRLQVFILQKACRQRALQGCARAFRIERAVIDNNIMLLKGFRRINRQAQIQPNRILRTAEEAPAVLIIQAIRHTLNIVIIANLPIVLIVFLLPKLSIGHIGIQLPPFAKTLIQ